MPDLRRRKEIARIRIFGDEAKSLLLAHAADHDRRMRPREALGRAQRALEREPFALETRLVALPHLQAQAEGVFEPIEPLGDGLKRDAEALRLVFVPPRTDAEHPAAPGQHVQCRDDLRDDTRVPVDGARDDRHEPRTGRVGGEVAEGGVGLEHVLLGRTDRLDLEEVIHHADEVEPALVGGARDLRKRRTDLFRAARPREERDLEADLHRGAAFRNRRVVHVSSIFANATGR